MIAGTLFFVGMAEVGVPKSGRVSVPVARIEAVFLGAMGSDAMAAGWRRQMFNELGLKAEKNDYLKNGRLEAFGRTGVHSFEYQNSAVPRSVEKTLVVEAAAGVGKGFADHLYMNLGIDGEYVRSLTPDLMYKDEGSALRSADARALMTGVRLGIRN